MGPTASLLGALHRCCSALPQVGGNQWNFNLDTTSYYYYYFLCDTTISDIIDATYSRTTDIPPIKPVVTLSALLILVTPLLLTLTQSQLSDLTQLDLLLPTFLLTVQRWSGKQTVRVHVE